MSVTTLPAQLLSALVLVVLPIVAYCEEPLTPLNADPARGDAEAYAHITGPGVPIQRFYNEDLEISFWRGPSPMTFNVAKNDVWDRRYFADGKRIIDIDAIREMCFGGEIPPQNGPFPTDSPQALYLAYDFPCPKPVGQLAIHCADLEGAEWKAGRTADGAMVAEAEAVELTAFLCRTQNVLVAQGEYEGLKEPVAVELYRHRDTTPEGTSVCGLAHYGGDTGYDYSQDPGNGPMAHPEAGEDGTFFWVRQQFPAEQTYSHHEEVDRDQVLGMIAQECPPGG